MPIFESKCDSCGNVLEWYASNRLMNDPTCESCGGGMSRLFSTCAVIWAKPMCDYGSKNVEGYAKQQKAGGHWAMEKRDDGSVGRCFIDSEQKNREYCRRNNLVKPSDLPSNLSVAKDGRSYETTNKCEI